MVRLPLRHSIPIALALVSVVLTTVGVVVDRTHTYQDLEADSARRITALNHLAVGTLALAAPVGGPALRSDTVERLRADSNVARVLVAGADDVVRESTDAAFRGRPLGAVADPALQAMVHQARMSGVPQRTIAGDGALLRVATPFAVADAAGLDRPLDVLVTEADLAAPKRARFDELLGRSLLFGAVALAACFGIWLYLGRTFTSQLSALTASVRSYPGAPQVPIVPTGGSSELAEIGSAITQMLADLGREHARVRESEEKFARIFMRAPVLVTLSDIDTGRIIDVNEGASRMTGFTRDEIIGSTPMALGWVTAEARAGMIEVLKRDGGVNGFEIAVRTRDGRTLECLLYADVVPMDGEIRLLVICQDVSEYKQAQQARLDSERQFRRLLDKAPMAICVVRDGTVQYANQALADMHQQPSPAAVVGQSIFGLVAPDQRPLAIERARQRMLGMPVEERFESAHLRADGTRFPVRAVVTNVRMSDGMTAIGFFEDVSVQRDTESRLRESEARFRAIVENSHDGIIFTDAAGTVLYRSPSFAAITGFDTAERLATNGFDNVHPDDLPAARARWQEMLAAPDAHAHLEFRARHEDGGWRWVDTSARNLLDNPSVGAVVVTSRDITERRRAEAERESLQAQLAQSQKIEAVGRLAGGVAHDFNNMLSVILGFAEMAIDSTEPGQPLRDDLLEIQKAAERSGSLTRQLLAFARQQPVSPRVIDLNATVQDMLTMLRRLIGENITLAWLPGAGLAKAFIDPTQIDQILANLCVNARDAIAGVGTVDIETSNAVLDADYCAGHPGAHPGHYVCLAVRDSGCGMSPELLTHIFEPFYTTKGVGKGTGLGLATVYGVVKQNAGYIDVHSRPQQGSRFAIYLPAHADDVARPPAPRAITPAVADRGTVLLVEDEASVLVLTKRVLEHLGYRVFAATTPQDALRLADEESGRIDLLMTDVIMPEMNGRELAERLQRAWPGIRCLFTSGYTADIIADHGVLDGSVQFLKKPWNKDELATKVQDALTQG